MNINKFICNFGYGFFSGLVSAGLIQMIIDNGFSLGIFVVGGLTIGIIQGGLAAFADWKAELSNSTAIKTTRKPKKGLLNMLFFL